jgi:nitroreductase
MTPLPQRTELMTQFHETMRTAATTRYYSSEAVAPAILYRVLDSARFAPSGGNRQGWRIIVVRDADRRRLIAEHYRGVWEPYRAQIGSGARASKLVPRSLQAADHFAAHLADVPVHLLVWVDIDSLQITDRELERVSIAGGASVYPFVQNVLLAAHAEGLGAAITTLLCGCESAIGDLCKAPEGLALAALVTLGHPIPEKVPRRLSRHPVPEFAFVEAFGGPPLSEIAP